VADKQTGTGGQKVSYFLAGAVIAAIALFFMYRFPGSEEGFDHDGDGVLDEIHHRQGDLLSKIEHDRNGDGNIDLQWIYGLDGLIESMKADNDFNGTFEQTVQYERGLPAVGKINASGEGPRDIRNNYQDGVRTDSELYDPFTNLRKKIIYYNAFGKVIKSEFDTTGDGKLDRKTTYDFFEDPLMVLEE
jgi:hypothetical protein